MRIDEPGLAGWEREFYAGFTKSAMDRSRVKVRLVASTPSTQDEAWRLTSRVAVDSRQAGVLAVLARQQVRGRGTHGRTWHDPKGGGMAMTLALGQRVCPWEVIGAGELSLASAVASVEGIGHALDARAGKGRDVAARVGIKWPNDITVSDHRGSAGLKLGGILIERKGATQGFEPVTLVGIGINTWQEKEDFPLEVRDRACSLGMLGAGVSRPLLAGAIAGSLVRILNDALALDAESQRRNMITQRWMRHDQTAGLACTLIHDGTRHEGVIEKVEPLEWVHLRLATGELKRLPAMSTTRERV